MPTPRAYYINQLLRTSALGLVLCAMPVSAGAVDTTWTGAADADWFNSTNWNTGNAPTIVDQVYVLTTSTNNDVVISGGDAFSNGQTLGTSSVNPATVTVTTGGTWTNDYSFYIGHYGSGTGILNIENGGVVNNVATRIGGGANTTGTVNVFGNGSVFNSTGLVEVGRSGDGTFSISDNGLAAVNAFDIGYEVGGTGLLSVTGTGSRITTISDIEVGRLGIGSLIASDNATISAGTGLRLGTSTNATGTVTLSSAADISTSNVIIAQNATSNGTLNIGAASGQSAVAAGTLTTPTISFGAGTGTLLLNHTNTDYDFDAAISGAGTIRAEGGTTNLTGDSSGFTGKVSIGTASLNVVGGALLSNDKGHIGELAGEVGTATVTGTGSSWDNASHLYVGNLGTGTLRVENGGAVTNTMGYVGAYAGSTGTAIVTGTGSSWANSNYLYVGQFDTGSLTVSNGGAVSNTNGYVGNNAVGTALVTGSGSTWTNVNDLYVGVNNHGTLNIEDGANVSSGAGYLGNGVSGVGIVNVTGANSTWTTTNNIRVGVAGEGTLSITNGGVVDSGRMFIGYNAGVQGHATVSGVNSTWTTTSSMGVGVNGIGDLTIADGGHVLNSTGYIGHLTGSTGTATITGANSRWDNTGTLFVGSYGDGSLVIEDGGVVTNANGNIGSQAGISGSASVTGSGSQWINSTTLIVGNSGAADLTVSDFGDVSTTGITIANVAGSTGTLNIGAASGDTAVAAGTLTTPTITFGAGTGTLLFNHTNTDYDFDAAISGVGTVRFNAGTTNMTSDSSAFAGNIYTDGGNVVVANGAKVGSNLTNTRGGSLVTLTGTGSSWDVAGGDFRVAYFGDSDFHVLNNATLTSTTSFVGYRSAETGTVLIDGAGSSWNNTTLYAAHYGVADVTIQNGGSITSDGGRIGYQVGSNGTVIVTGNSSNWQMSSTLRIGRSGTGILNILDGGSVQNAHSNVGYYAGSEGTVNVTGSGSSWVNNNNLSVGQWGTGVLTISDGGVVSNVVGYIAQENGSSGTVNVRGSGSTWANSGHLYINDTLNIEDSASVTNTLATIGSGSSSNATVTVVGSGSTWASSNILRVGENGAGTLNVLDGAIASTTRTIIAGAKTSNGTINISGTGSRLTNSENLYVGSGWNGAASAQLNILDGAVVTNVLGGIGDNPNVVGTVTVSGAGSTWTNSADLNVGDDGTGTLTISNSGSVSATAVNAATNAGSTSTLNIGAATGQAAVTAGTLTTPTVTFGAGTGTLLFNHTNSVADPYLFAPDIIGAGTVKAEGGVTTLTGDLSGFTGTAFATDNATLNFGVAATYAGDLEVDHGGTLVANNTVSGTVTVNDGGTLKGSGTVGDTAVASGGIVAPGNSIGTINISGNVSFAAGSFLDTEVNASGASDLTHATGTATITGGTVRLIPEFVSDTYALGTPYTVLTADGGITGTFDAITLSAASLFLSPFLTYDATNAYATVVRNGSSFASTARTTNQRKVAVALDSMPASSPAALAVAKQSTAAATQGAMDKLSGEFYANLKSQVLDESQSFAHLINGHSGSGYWSTFYGQWQERDSSLTQGFEANLSGVAFGDIKAVNDNTEVGFALAYEHSNYTQEAGVDNSTTAKANKYRAAVFATQTHGPWILKANAQYGYQQFDAKRHVVFTDYEDTHRTIYDAHNFTGYGEVAYNFFQTPKMLVQPYAGFSYGYGLITSFQESGDGGLSTASDGFHEGSTNLGVRFKQKLIFSQTPATLTADLGWQHRVGGATPTGNYKFNGSNAFKSQGTMRRRDGLTFSTGLNFKLTSAVDLDLTYDTDQSPAANAHSAKLGLKIKFQGSFWL